MKIVVVFISLLISLTFFSQEDLSPYNEDFEFEVMDEDEVISRNDSLHALIIDAGNSVKNIEISLKNTPQLREVKLMSSSQEILDVIGRVKLDSLFFLLIENYHQWQLFLHCFWQENSAQKCQKFPDHKLHISLFKF